jgi:hypothetical protein
MSKLESDLRKWQSKIVESAPDYREDGHWPGPTVQIQPDGIHLPRKTKGLELKKNHFININFKNT